MRAGFLVFPGVTQLDLTGPWEVLRRIPGMETVLVWKDTGGVIAEGGLRFAPDTSLTDCPALDVVVVPGGGGVNDLLTDGAVTTFVAERAVEAQLVLGVCTGALLLGAAGLLQGRRATTHWSAQRFLLPFNAEPGKGRVVEDGRVITCGGVTAGIDAALLAVSRLVSRRLAEAIQLQLEYDPQPPFDCGSPGRADADLLLAVERHIQPTQRQRAAAVFSAADALAKRASET